MQVSIYKNKSDNTGTVIKLAKVLGMIRKGKWRQQIGVLRDMDKAEYDASKGEMLPGITFSGVFSPRRSLSTCSQYNGMLVLDVDHLDEQPLEDLKDALRKDPYALCFFVSPSNAGLKILVRVDSAKEDHYSAFECLRMYFLNIYGVELDKSGKNIDRLCFASFDPDLYYNGTAQVFPVEVSEEMRNRVYADREVAYKGFSVTTNDRDVYATCRAWAEYYKPYAEGGRNTHIHKCACDLNRCGMSMENAILCIARDRIDLSVQEIKDTVRKVYKANQKEHNTITIYDFDKEQDGKRSMVGMASVGDMVDDLMAAGDEGLIPTGYPKRDKVFGGGKERGAVYAYVGREKTYKSVDAVREACHLALNKQPVLYLNGEMSKRQLLQIIAQQQLGIPRPQFKENLERIKQWAEEHLSRYLLVITGRDFSHDKILVWVKSVEASSGEKIVQVFVDGISHMEQGKMLEIEALIYNSKMAKEIAKDTNAAVTVLIHTDASCDPWSRRPQSFIRGKTKVLSNFDGTVGFSRFIIPGTENEDWTDFELSNERYHVKAEDYRLTGDSADVVMDVSNNCCPVESEEDPIVYELQKPEKQRRY